MRSDRWEPRLFATWLRELGKLVYEDELGAMLPEVWSDTPTLLPEVLRDVEGRARWCDDGRTRSAESCSQLVGSALARALDQLRRGGHAPPTQRTWGQVHYARFAHVPFGQVPVLRSLFDVEVPTHGGNETINLGEYTVEQREDPYVSRYGPGMRAIYDLASPERSVFMIGPGQSGHPLSPYYRNWRQGWADGAHIPMITDRASASRNAIGTLMLRPR
jgi:penicillin G amidase